MTAIIYNFQEIKDKKRMETDPGYIRYIDDPRAVKDDDNTPSWVRELIEYYGN